MKTLPYVNPCCPGFEITELQCDDCILNDKLCGACRGTGYNLQFSKCENCDVVIDNTEIDYDL
jgi:hypothetical protein